MSDSVNEESTVKWQRALHEAWTSVETPARLGCVAPVCSTTAARGRSHRRMCTDFFWRCCFICLSPPKEVVDLFFQCPRPFFEHCFGDDTRIPSYHGAVRSCTGSCDEVLPSSEDSEPC